MNSAYFRNIKHATSIQWELGQSPGMSLHLGTRAYNALDSHFNGAVWNTADVRRLSRHELMRIPNMGKRSIQWVTNWLAARGVKPDGEFTLTDILMSELELMPKDYQVSAMKRLMSTTEGYKQFIMHPRVQQWIYDNADFIKLMVEWR